MTTPPGADRPTPSPERTAGPGDGEPTAPAHGATSPRGPVDPAPDAASDAPLTDAPGDDAPDDETVDAATPAGVSSQEEPSSPHGATQAPLGDATTPDDGPDTRADARPERDTLDGSLVEPPVEDAGQEPPLAAASAPTTTRWFVPDLPQDDVAGAPGSPQDDVRLPDDGQAADLRLPAEGADVEVRPDDAEVDDRGPSDDGAIDHRGWTDDAESDDRAWTGAAADDDRGPAVDTAHHGPRDAGTQVPATPGAPDRDAPVDERPVDPASDLRPAPGPAPSAASGWAVLGRALRPRATRAQVLAGVLCALLGFALAVQIRQASDTTLSGLRQADLVRLVDEVTTRGDALERERADLAAERDELLSGSDRQQAALDALRRSAETQGILTGRLPAEGPGIVATLVEPDGLIKPVTMLNMLEELRNAGAEAIQLNDQRITASSAFTGVSGAIQLDGVTLSAPYVWVAIGDPDTMATALQIPGGALAQVRGNGGRGTVERADLVEVSAIRVVPDPVHATPVPAESE